MGSSTRLLCFWAKNCKHCEYYNSDNIFILFERCLLILRRLILYFFLSLFNFIDQTTERRMHNKCLSENWFIKDLVVDFVWKNTEEPTWFCILYSLFLTIDVFLVSWHTWICPQFLLWDLWSWHEPVCILITWTKFTWILHAYLIFDVH